MNEELKKYIRKNNLVVFPKYDDAILGIVESPNCKPVVCYEVQIILDKLMVELGEGTERPDAIEYYEYNILGGHFGDRTPIFVDSDSYFCWLIQSLDDEADDQNFAEIYEYVEEQEVTLLSDYLNCAISIGDRCALPSVVVYDREKLVEQFTVNNEVSVDAESQFQEAIFSRSIADTDPVFLTKY